MAATIAKAIGHARSGKRSEASRLGHEASEGRAQTWRTFGAVLIRADGSGEVEVKRDGKVIHAHTFGPEVAPDTETPANPDTDDDERGNR